MTARLALRYLAIFAVVLALLSAGAYEFLAREYQGLLAPALGTPETARAYAVAMRRIFWTIVAFDVPLLVLVGAASWLLARASLEPLVIASERERAFAVDAAHALRSPLATIASVAQAARGTESSEKDEALETIAHAAVDASAVVGDLLTLARSAQPERLACEPLDFAAVIADTSKEFFMVAQQRGIELRRDLRSAIVDGDERRLRELTRNLLDNALRHARSAVTLSARPDGRWVELTVGNDGDAIPAELRERVFERFFSANGAQGSGLGLSIVRWIAQAHGGSAFVRENQTGESEFVVRLPAVA
jgi:two-component system, OmpR family, sensor histidine kinase CiaH